MVRFVDKLDEINLRAQIPIYTVWRIYKMAEPCPELLLNLACLRHKLG